MEQKFISNSAETMGEKSKLYIKKLHFFLPSTELGIFSLQMAPMKEINKFSS
jgi:hypothetical protein